MAHLSSTEVVKHDGLALSYWYIYADLVESINISHYH